MQGKIFHAKTQDLLQDRDVLKRMFGLRNKVFKEQLGWQVKSRYGLERDSYDNLDPTYLLATHKDGRVEGCGRLLPTTGPYMLKDTFPQLLCGESAPQQDHIWEFSRFAVSPAVSPAISSASTAEAVQASVNAVTLGLLRCATEYAHQNGIRHYVFVTSVSVERLLKKMGIPVQRFGNHKARRVGKVMSVACWVDINDRLDQALYGAVIDRVTQEAA